MTKVVADLWLRQASHRFTRDAARKKGPDAAGPGRELIAES